MSDKNDIKIPFHVLSKIMKPKNNDFRLPNGVAIIDFQNIIYGAKFLNGNTNRSKTVGRFMFDKDSSENFIELAIKELTDYINDLPKEIEKVCIFSNRRDGNYHNLRLSKDIIPFEQITKEDLKEFGFNNTSNYGEKEMMNDMYFNIDSFGFPLLRKPTKELPLVFELPEEQQQTYLNELMKMYSIIKFPKQMKYIDSPDRIKTEYNRKSFINHMSVKDLLYFFYANIIEGVRYNINQSEQKRELLHISTPLEDDFGMRLYIERLINENPGKELSFYVFSDDRDVILNFSNVKNTLWFNNYKKHNPLIFLIEDFWNKIDPDHVLNDVSKRLIYGLIGSDYTTFIMNKFDINRLNLDSRKEPKQVLKEYINTKFNNGKLIRTNENVSNDSIINHIKYLSTTIHNNSYEKLFICSFDALIGFENCSFHLLNSNAITYPTVQDRFEACMLERSWKWDWNGECLYTRADMKHQFESKRIELLTKNGMINVENIFVPVELTKEGKRIFIKVKSFNKFSKYKNDNKYIQSLINIILLIIRCKNKHNSEFFTKIIEKLITLDAWRYLLTRKEKEFLKRIIINKFNLLSIDEFDYSSIFSINLENKNENNLKRYSIQRKIIEYGRHLEYGIEYDINDFPLEEQYKIISRDFN